VKALLWASIEFHAINFRQYGRAPKVPQGRRKIQTPCMDDLLSSIILFGIFFKIKVLKIIILC
jgi:hypothetical protein